MAWLVAVVVVVAWCAGRGAGFVVEVSPSGEWKVPEDTPHNLTLSLVLSDSEAARVLAYPAGAVVEVAAWHREAWRLAWQRRVVQWSPLEAAEGVNKTLTFTGYFWGRTRVGLFLTRNDLPLTPQRTPGENDSLHDPWDDLHTGAWPTNDTWGDLHLTTNLTLLNDLKIVVDRGAQVLEAAFIGLGSTFLLINNINMGAQLDLGVIRAVLRRPLGPVVGFVSQFVFMPLSTFVMGYYFFEDPLYRLGLFTLGCSPGGMSSNFWTLMFGGDINLSITMTSVSTVAAMAMMPFWMFTLAQQLLKDGSMTVPYGNLVISLITLTVPMGVGVAIRAWRPVWAAKGAKVIKPFTMVILLFFLSFVFYTSYKVFLMMTWQMAVAGFLVSGLGFAFGATFARLFCLPKKQIIAICIETAFQNGGVVFILLKLSLPSPDSDLAALPAMATMLQTGPPMIIFYVIYTALRRYCGCCPEKEEEAEAEEKEQLSKENQEKTDAERAKEIDAFLSKPDKNIFTDSVMDDTKNRYGLLLEGMTKIKLTGTMQETNLL